MKESNLLAILVAATFLAGCTHVPVNVKNASARQAELLTKLDQSLEAQSRKDARAANVAELRPDDRGPRPDYETDALIRFVPLRIVHNFRAELGETKEFLHE